MKNVRIAGVKRTWSPNTAVIPMSNTKATPFIMEAIIIYLKLRTPPYRPPICYLHTSHHIAIARIEA